MVKCVFYYPDSCADMVLLANVMHGAPIKARLLKSERRVLKPGGRIVAMNWGLSAKLPAVRRTGCVKQKKIR